MYFIFVLSTYTIVVQVERIFILFAVISDGKIITSYVFYFFFEPLLLCKHSWNFKRSYNQKCHPPDPYV